MIDLDNISVDELVEILQEASDRYFNDGESDLTDAEFDALEAVLREMDPLNPFLLATGATERGGKVPLPVPMGGLDQAYEGDVQKWLVSEDLFDEDFVVSEKLDGTSALLVYGNGGEFQIAFSRGNGYEGADITRHLKRMGIPQKISGPMILRAEVIIPKANWLPVQEKMLEATGRTYKNARNFGAGMMNKKVAPDIFYDNAHVVLYGMIRPDSMPKRDQLVRLMNEGFRTVFIETVAADELTDENLQRILKEMKEESRYELDGVVIEVNSADKRAAMTSETDDPEPPFARKYKVGAEDNVAVTKVVAVHWKASKHGYLKPRVEIEPVDLVGVTITFATGFNAKFIKEQGIGPGAEIQITRSGDVIPFIQRVNKSVSPSMPSVTEFGDYAWSENEVDLIMTSGNDDVEFEKLKYFFGKLSVDHAGEGNIRKMFDAGYRTPFECVIRGEGEWKRQVGDSAGSKIYKSLVEKLNPVKLEVLAAASGLFERGIGERKLAPIVKEYGTLDVPISILMTVEGIQERTAKKIAEGMPAFLKFQADLAGFFKTAEVKKDVSNGSMSGQYVVFTGIRDKDLEAEMEAQGAEIGSSMGKCTLLVAKDPGSSSGKAQKARESGIKIVSHSEAKAMV